MMLLPCLLQDAERLLHSIRQGFPTACAAQEPGRRIPSMKSLKGLPVGSDPCTDLLQHLWGGCGPPSLHSAAVTGLKGVRGFGATQALTSSLGLMLYRILSAFSLSCLLSMIAKSSFEALFWKEGKKKPAITASSQKKLGYPACVQPTLLPRRAWDTRFLQIRATGRHSLPASLLQDCSASPPKHTFSSNYGDIQLSSIFISLFPKPYYWSTSD